MEIHPFQKAHNCFISLNDFLSAIVVSRLHKRRFFLKNFLIFKQSSNEQGWLASAVEMQYVIKIDQQKKTYLAELLAAPPPNNLSVFVLPHSKTLAANSGAVASGDVMPSDGS